MVKSFVWMVDIYDEPPSKHTDRLLLSSVATLKQKEEND